MKRKTANLNKAMRDKVTPAQFFRLQWKIIKELYQEYKLRTLFIIVTSCITSVGTSIIELKFIEYATNNVDTIVKGQYSDANVNPIYILALFIFALFILKIISSIYEVISQKYQSDISFRAEKKITDKLSGISYEYYESSEFYEKINLARQASGQYSSAVYGVTQIFNIIIMLSVYAVMLSKLNLMFLIVIFISIVVSIVLSSRVTDKQLDYWRVNVSPVSRRTDYFSKIIGNKINHQNIQMNRSLPYFENKFSSYNQQKCRNYRKLNMFSFLSEIAATLLFMITFIVTALFVGNGVVSSRYDIGYFTMIIALLFNLFTYLKQFSMFINNKNWYIKVLSAYYEIIGGSNGTQCIDSNEENDTIILKHIEYKYPQAETYSLKGINAEFKLGEKIAIVGLNGSGKTTFTSIILSLLLGYQGEYLGKDIVKTAILQDFCQYQMTIKQNIEIGCCGEELPEDKINEILKKVDLFEYVSTLPDGINTMLGQLDDGVELSKGQWQRLVIARLLANTNAKVWILDEPTAYLDPISELEMYRQIWELSDDKLVFFISHRLGFAKEADRIILVDEGKIIEEGTHRDLINANGQYASMFTAQKEWYV